MRRTPWRDFEPGSECNTAVARYLIQDVEEFIQKLSHENREMIIRYYQGEKGDKIRNRKELAKRLGIPQNTLRIRVFRIRERLEKMVRARLDLMIAAGDGGSPQKLMRNYSAP